MRLNVAVSGLLACSIGISAAGTVEGLALREDPGTTVPIQNSVIRVKQIIPALSSPPTIQRTSFTKFEFATNGAEINTFRLKFYNYAGPSNGDGDGIIANSTFQSSQPPSATDGNAMLNRDEGGTASSGFPSFPSLLNPMSDNSIVISWAKSDANITNQPLYLETEWTRSPDSGSSTTQLFAVYDGDNQTLAAQSLPDVEDESNPARQEISTPIPTSPSPTTKPLSSTSPTSSGTTIQPTAAAGSSTPAPTGLDRNGIIGVAVGVSVGGLLVGGVLSWLFCFRRRRRRNTAAHHAMPSYASDLGVRAMMQDKDIPVVLESSTPPYAGGDEGRPSTDHYAPYSDRSTMSPTPDHRRTDSGTTAAAVAPDVGAARGAPSPTPAIVTRYAHLVEEGMTDDEIRRLEEEERQLDAAIENAGRRGNS